MEKIIQQMLSNQISMREFLQLISSNKDIVNYINTLVPNDSKNNPGHPIWRQFSYDALKAEDFALWDEVKKVCRFDDSLGDNLNIFEIIRVFYCYSHPNFQYTLKYHEEFVLLLDIAGESFGGPEVDKLINEIVSQNVSIQPKTRRIREAKKQLKTVFHVSENKRPYWINGAEWPMGTSSPMRYIDSISTKGGKKYRFQDEDTGVIREVIQYY